MELMTYWRLSMVFTTLYQLILIIAEEITNNIYKMQKMMQPHKQLNILVCGPSGIGKTAFVKLFLKKFNYE